MKNSTLMFLLTAASVLMLTGCAGGPQFSDVKKSGVLEPHNGKGMVLIYRTPGFVSAAYKPYLYVNQVEQPSRLSRGGFYSYEAAPGLLHLAYSKQPGESTSETRTRAVVGGVVAGALIAGPVGAAVMGGLGAPADIEQHRKVGLDLNIFPRETRYVAMGGAGGPLKEVPKADAEEEIESCHWLNPSAR
jgi:hypothetical protein